MLFSCHDFVFEIDSIFQVIHVYPEKYMYIQKNTCKLLPKMS